MTLGYRPKMDTLVLSSGSPFQTTYQEDIAFPDGAESRIEFYDSSGVLIARLPGTLDGQNFTFDFPSEITDTIPHGAQFKFSIIYPGEEPICITYGTTIRVEPRFSNASTNLSTIPQLFSDNFQRPLIGPKWIQVYQNTTIHINAAGQPAGLALDSTKYEASGVLWNDDLSGDSATVNVNLLVPNAGKTGIVLCSNSTMTFYLGVMVNSGSSPSLNVISGTGPSTYNVLQTASVTSHTNDNLLIIYNALSDTLLCYRNNDLSAPVLSEAGIAVSHGPGFRYTGANWVTATTGVTGPQLTSWQAQDGVSLI